MRMKMLGALVLLCATPAVAGSDVNAQWKRVDGKYDLSMHDLVSSGYEIKSTQADRNTNWIYLQKGQSVFRCDADIFVASPGNGMPTCLELVKPFKYTQK